MPRIAKWPFLFGDALLLCLAAWIVFQNPRPLDLWLQILVISCVAAASWLGVWPFIEEYRAKSKAPYTSQEPAIILLSAREEEQLKSR